MRKIKILSIVWFCLVCCQIQNAYTQITNEAAGAGTFHNLNLGVCENLPVNIPNTHTASADATPACNTTVGTILQDSWFNVISNATGLLAFSVSPTSGNANLAIAVYNGASSSASLLNCTNLYAGTDRATETVLISAVSGNTYTVRLMNLTTAANTAYTANISIYSGPILARDLCVNAVSVAIGTCDFTFNVENGYVHNEANSTALSCPNPKTAFSDGWFKIELAENTRIRVEYENSNKDASIQAYSATTTLGGNCGALTYIDCADAINGFSSAEVLEFTANLAGTNTYFVRIANMTDNDAMLGEICIEEILARDLCVDIVSHPAQIKIGDCGVRVSIPNSFNLDDEVLGCNDAAPFYDNAWLKYTATTNTRVRLEVSSNTNVGLAVITLGTPNDCSSAKNLVAPDACISAAASSAASYSFDVTSGTTYYFEIVGDQSSPFIGYACLYEDAKKSEDVYYAANVLDATGQDCGKTFNILSSFEATGIRGGVITGRPTSLTSCTGSPTATADAWGAFQIALGALPASGLLVEFDNNDGRNATTPLNTALEVYKGGSLQTPTSVDDNTCTLASAASTSINVNSFITGLAVDQNNGALPTLCGVSPNREKWVRYNHTAGTTAFRVAFKSTASANFVIEVRTACATVGTCGAKGTSTGHTSGFPDLATVAISPPGNGVYFIRVACTGGGSGITGDLSVNITSQLTFMGCSNTVLEGNESVLLSGGTFTDDTQYYFRIATIQIGGTNSVTGRACLRNNAIPQGDLCSNAIGLLVGDCDVQISLTGDGGGEDRFLNNQTVPFPTGGCNPGGTYRDGWFSFTATTSSTTIEYTQQTGSATQNAALEMYRGTCASLFRLNRFGASSSCADDFVVGATGVEKFVVATIPGIVYYGRIINRSFSNNLTGKLCIYNTVGRDACIDNDLMTLNVGDCNQIIDVPTTFDTDAYPLPISPLLRNFLAGQALPFTETGGSLIQYVQSSCETEGTFTNTNTNPLDGGGLEGERRDAWLRLIGNGNEVTLNFSTTGGTANPAISVYTALKSVGPVNCGTGLSGANNPANQYACANNVNANTTQTESVTFRTNSGQQYLIRIINLNGAVNLTGTLCISDGRNNYDNPCLLSTTGPRNVAIGSCSVPMNVVNTGTTACYDPANTSTNYNSASSCDDCVNRDAWAVIVRPYVCDPALPVPTPSTAVVSGTTLISCPTPYRVNVGTDGVVGGTATDVCECGSNATNNCQPPPISASPTSCPCGVGYTCQNDATTGFTDKCVPAGYIYSRGNDGTLNTLDDTYTPVPTGTVCPRPYSYNAGTGTCVCAQSTIRPTHPNNITIEYNNQNGVSDVAADAAMVIYQTTNCNDENAYTQLACRDAVPAGTEGTESHNITGLPMTHSSGGETYYVRIMNKTANKTLIGSLCVYYGSDISSLDCSFPLNEYGELEGEFKNFTVEHDNTPPPTGENLPSATIPNCVLPGGFPPITSNSTDPIRSDAWMQFTVPANVSYSAVTVQFDNTGFLPARNAAIAIYTSPEIPTGTSALRDNNTTSLTLNCNAYGASDPNPLATPNRGGLFLLDCQNGVFVGAETATINTTYNNGAQPNVLPTNVPRTYYVRVMNVHNENIPSTLAGRIRIFPAATCNLGSELVIDGDFERWPALTYPSGIVDNTTVPNTVDGINNYYATRDAAIIRIPNIGTNDPYPNDIDGVFGASSGATVNTGVARFATDYGYLRESGTYLTGDQTITFAQARSNSGSEFNPEGLYTVRQSPWTLKQNWFCFGVGFSGYGGRNPDSNGEPQAHYCTNGALGIGSEACQVVSLENGLVTTIGSFNTTHTTNASTSTGTPLSPIAPDTDGLAPFQPAGSSANFMIINGSFNPASNLPPGKIWCQTIQRNVSDYNDVSYYLFSVWVQNMKQIGSNSDVPQLRLTVCDMEDPSNPGSFPSERDIYTTTNGDTGADDVRLTRLPGITDVALSDGAAFNNANSSSGIGISADASENSAQRVRHLPRPGVNRRFALVSTGLRPAPYGAAMPCNLTQSNGWTGAEDIAENMNARLKVLGASFLIPERPDNWVLVRCVYRAPRFVKEMNICLENLSLTKNGNDFGIDGISFRKCDAANQETFDRLLKGDPCALSTDGRITGLPLTANLIDFSAKLLGDKVALIWTAVNESQTSHYQLQRSIDGVNFVAIANIDAKKALQGYSNYEYLDINFPQGIKQIYYRLNSINTDGFEKQGSVVIVEIPHIENFDLKLKPNPINRGSEFTLQFHALQKGQASISITDLMGNQHMRTIVQVKGGSEEITVKAGNLKAGLYIVRMSQGGKVATKKLVIQ